ncbi:hypothetical protein BOX15_Mlig023434g2 [Macrostomum lignano]|uniref:N-acylethanolamine-hydrolyzing acid amidase n=1 Tax=Macrostomum lignano TaxID=282301 RepID=A0A267GRG9_9PLAT|nr:hypothetical protein BOX15_Mlig023434g2 [Macrostomum lignano]
MWTNWRAVTGAGVLLALVAAGTSGLAVPLVLIGQAQPVPRGAGRAPPLYRVDLDQDPAARWAAVVADFKADTQQLIKAFLGSVPLELKYLADVVAADLDTHLPADYGAELLGISKTVNASLGDIVLLNLIYDVTAFCTGIIANDRNGGLWHGRNLDYGNTMPQTDMLEKVTIRVDFYRQRQLLYSAVSFAGYAGILTGWKPHQFAITVNERDKGNFINNIVSALQELLNGGKLYPVTMMTRLAFEQDTDFASVVSRLSSAQLIAPVYYIISGNQTDQGIVLVRTQYKTLGTNQLDQKSGKWFIVETNYDPWMPPPPGDDRRDPAIKAMNSLGQARLSLEGLFNVLSVPPVNNNHTVYTAVFSATRPATSKAVIRDSTEQQTKRFRALMP